MTRTGFSASFERRPTSRRDEPIVNCRAGMSLSSWPALVRSAFANPPPEVVEVGGIIEEAVAEATRKGVSGQAVTPFVLAFLHERSGGRTREVNRSLAVANARLAAEVSLAFAGL